MAKRKRGTGAKKVAKRQPKLPETKPEPTSIFTRDDVQACRDRLVSIVKTGEDKEAIAAAKAIKDFVKLQEDCTNGGQVRIDTNPDGTGVIEVAKSLGIKINIAEADGASADPGRKGR